MYVPACLDFPFQTDILSGQLAPWTIRPRQLAPDLQTTIILRFLSTPESEDRG